ncbi:MAG: von Willebrand factor type A domain-containing protein, partial [Pseudomonadales bacterium]|nr:von Willebrand factor type A domain-containing protein [Pseudomonadales bacterium]
PYDYAPPHDAHPFAAHMEIAPCPWNASNRLVRIGLKGKELDAGSRPPLNLVFLLDVSGSMNAPNKLPLVKRAMNVLVNQLDQRDRVSIVVYAGAAGIVLPPTSGNDPQAILDAIERLQAGGSTAGGAGIELAYKTAQENFDAEAVNRVILCTDGDFNVGMTQPGDLVRLIEEKAKTGIFLNVLGFGMGNYKDSTLEDLSNKGNGMYAYIDDFSEARKVLVDQMTGTLVTIAKDVKIQVEFNPAMVAGYRLIGYENRMLKKEDFNNDKVDAGEIGAGHTVTAFYELVPAGQGMDDVPPVDALKYQSETAPSAAAGEWLTLKLRYKLPDGDTSTKVEYPLVEGALVGEVVPSTDFRFAASVAAFGQLLRESPFVTGYTYDDVIDLAQGSLGSDRNGYRAEFLKLVRNAKAIAK